MKSEPIIMKNALLSIEANRLGTLNDYEIIFNDDYTKLWVNDARTGECVLRIQTKELSK